MNKASPEFWRARMAEPGHPVPPELAGVGYQLGEELRRTEDAARRVLAEHVRPGDRVLDVCCGCGALLPLMPDGVWYAGLDLMPEFLRFARRHADDGRAAAVAFVPADLRDPDPLGRWFGPDSFDVAVGRAVGVVREALGEVAWAAAVRGLLRLAPKVVLFDYDGAAEVHAREAP